jgi:predicted acyltransferase
VQIDEPRRDPVPTDTAPTSSITEHGGASAERPRPPRLVGVDAFRGLLLALMLWTPPLRDGDAYPWLYHAPWDGWTLADLVFPAFLVTSGASLAFLLRPPVTRATRLRLVRRTIALVVLGILYNAYGTSGADLSTVRLTGVLQLIGLSGALAAVFVLVTRRRDGIDRPAVIATAAVAIVALHATGLARRTGTCTAIDLCSPYHDVDVRLLGAGHLYREGGVAYDPEGLAVVVAASALVLAGYLVGRHLRLHRPLTWRAPGAIAAAGTALITLTWLLQLAQPVNKRLHTPAFTTLTGGVALLGIALAVVALDSRIDGRWSGLARRTRAAVADPFVTLGRNALMVFLSERVILQTLHHTPVGDTTAERWVLAHLVPIAPPAAVLGYSTLLVVAVVAIAYGLRALRWRIVL